MAERKVDPDLLYEILAAMPPDVRSIHAATKVYCETHQQVSRTAVDRAAKKNRLLERLAAEGLGHGANRLFGAAVEARLAGLDTSKVTLEAFNGLLQSLIAKAEDAIPNVPIEDAKLLAAMIDRISTGVNVLAESRKLIADLASIDEKLPGPDAPSEDDAPGGNVQVFTQFKKVANG